MALTLGSAVLGLVYTNHGPVLSALVWEDAHTLVRLPDNLHLRLVVTELDKDGQAFSQSVNAIVERLQFAVYTYAKQLPRNKNPALEHELAQGVQEEERIIVTSSRTVNHVTSNTPDDDEASDDEGHARPPVPRPTREVKIDVTVAQNLWVHCIGHGNNTILVAVTHHVVYQILIDLIGNQTAGGIKCKNGKRYLLAFADATAQVPDFTGAKTKESREHACADHFVNQHLRGVRKSDIFTPKSIPPQAPDEFLSWNVTLPTERVTLVWTSATSTVHELQHGRFEARLGLGAVVAPKRKRLDSEIHTGSAESGMEIMDHLGNLTPMHAPDTASPNPAMPAKPFQDRMPKKPRVESTSKKAVAERQIQRDMQAGRVKGISTFFIKPVKK